MKPGYETTEFWAAISAMVVAVLGAISSLNAWIQAVVIFSAALVLCVYVYSRAIVKTGK